MQRPTAAPRIPASESGVSTQRSAPNRSRRPAVARNTPPRRPTSSPSTMTVSSRASSTCRASLTASTSSSSRVATAVALTAVHPPELVEVACERGGWLGVRVGEDELRVAGGLVLGRLDAGAHRRERLLADGGGALVVEHAEPRQVALVDRDAVPLAARPRPARDRCRGSGRRRSHAAPTGTSRPRRTSARRRARARADPLAHRLVDREHVVPVDPDRRACRSRRPCPTSRAAAVWALERRRDRPLVVVAEEDERRLDHRGDVRALVERALGGRAVAEERQRRPPRIPSAAGPRRARRRAGPASRSGRRSTRR